MKLSTISIGLLAAALSCGKASAAETTFAAGAQFNPLRQEGGTARAMGMGSAVVGVRQDSASLLWNPAGLGYMSAKEIGLHHNSGLGSSIQEIAVFGMPLGEVKEQGQGGEHGGLAVSLGYVNYGSIAGADDSGRATGFYGSNDISGSVGWGKQLFRNVSAGVALKASRSTFGGKGYSDVATDVGVLWNALPTVHLGAGYSNLAFGGASGATTASGLRLGAGWDATKHWLLAASAELQRKALNRLQLGTEYLIGDVDDGANVLALRGGYQLDFPSAELGALNGLTLGLGYAATRSFSVDYAILPAGDLGTSHRLSLTLKFNSPGKAAPVAAAAAVAPAAKPKPVKPPVVKLIVLEDSHFDFDKSTLRPEGMAALKENIQLMKNNPNTHVRVAGYTSMSGTAEYNQRLSERRASAVRDFMIADGGLDQSRITMIGYGATRPKSHEADPNDIDTKAAKSNMRVLFEMSVK
ncbi:MAG: PorV/PorQ family protein [Elusimicrobiota bacterium]|nr:MAG: PorV/PorQ family protein [Elusimicrobiota bacterium]